MKDRLVFLILSSLVLVVLIALGPSTPVPGSAPADRVAGDGLVEVDDLAQAPAQYTGAVEVAGVVGATSAEREMIVLVDRREFEECGVTSCAAIMLPVQWTGDMPQLASTVLARGEVKKTPRGFLLAASTVETLKPPPETAVP